MKIKPATPRQRIALETAIQYLKKARECLARADCPKTLRRVRLCLTSAGGAERHLRHRMMRTRPDGSVIKAGDFA